MDVRHAARRELVGEQMRGVSRVAERDHGALVRGHVTRDTWRQDGTNLHGLELVEEAERELRVVDGGELEAEPLHPQRHAAVHVAEVGLGQHLVHVPADVRRDRRELGIVRSRVRRGWHGEDLGRVVDHDGERGQAGVVSGPPPAPALAASPPLLPAGVQAGLGWEGREVKLLEDVAIEASLDTK